MTFLYNFSSLVLYLDFIIDITCFYNIEALNITSSTKLSSIIIIEAIVINTTTTGFTSVTVSDISAISIHIFFVFPLGRGSLKNAFLFNK